MSDDDLPVAIPAPNLSAVASAVMALAGVRRGHVVVDLATGAGRWARPAAAAATAAGRVLAVGPDLLSFGDSLTRVPDPAWAPILHCLADPAALPLADHSADLAMWVTGPTGPRSDDDAVLAELARVMRPGSRVVVSFPGGSTAAPLWRLAEHGFGVAHVTEEQWGTFPLALVVARCS